MTISNLIFDGGVRGHIFVSWLHPFKEQKLVVIGDRCMAVFDDTVQDGKLKISSFYREAGRMDERTPRAGDQANTIVVR